MAIASPPQDHKGLLLAYGANYLNAAYFQQINQYNGSTR